MAVQNVIILSMLILTLLMNSCDESFICLLVCVRQRTNQVKFMNFRKQALTCSIHSYCISLNQWLWSAPFVPDPDLIAGDMAVNKTSKIRSVTELVFSCIITVGPSLKLFIP